MANFAFRVFSIRKDGESHVCFYAADKEDIRRLAPPNLTDHMVQVRQFIFPYRGNLYIALASNDYTISVSEGNEDRKVRERGRKALCLSYASNCKNDELRKDGWSEIEISFMRAINSPKKETFNLGMSESFDLDLNRTNRNAMRTWLEKQYVKCCE